MTCVTFYTCDMCQSMHVTCVTVLACAVLPHVGNAGLLNRTGEGLQLLLESAIGPLNRRVSTNVQEGGFGNGNNALLVAFTNVRPPIFVTVCETPGTVTGSTAAHSYCLSQSMEFAALVCSCHSKPPQQTPSCWPSSCSQALSSCMSWHVAPFW